MLSVKYFVYFIIIIFCLYFIELEFCHEFVYNHYIIRWNSKYFNYISSFKIKHFDAIILKHFGGFLYLFIYLR